MNRLHPLRACVLLAALVLIPHCLVAQLTWTSANVGLEGGSIRSLHPTPGGSMLASTARGLYRIDDVSDAWVPVLRQTSALRRVESDRDGTLHLLQDLPGTSTRSYLRSTDDGRTWTQPLDTGSATLLAGDGDVVLLFGPRGLSTDGGSTWTVTDEIAYTLVVGAGSGRFVASSYAARLFTSTDRGRTWSDAGPTPAVITAMVALGDHVFALSPDTLFTTSDGGATWRRAFDAPVGAIARIGDAGLIISSRRRDRHRATDGIHRSDDSGRTWRQIAQGHFNDVAATLDGSIYAESFRGVVSTSDGGTTWREVNSGLEERSVNVWAEPDGTLYGTAWRNDFMQSDAPVVVELYRSRDDAATWQLALDSALHVRSFIGGRGIAATRTTTDANDPGATRDSVVVSVDHGTRWRTLSAGSVLATASAGDSLAAVSVLTSPTGSLPNLYVTTDNGSTWIARTTPTRHDRMAITASGMIVVGMNEIPYRLAASTDLGATWRTLSEGRSVSGVLAPGGEEIVAVLYDETDATAVIEHSPDGGATFTRTKTRDRYRGMTQVNGVTLMFMRSGFEDVIWRSSDSGATWASAPIGDRLLGPWPPVFASTGVILATRPAGLFRSTDHGVTWHTIDTSTQLVVQASNGRVIVAAHSYGGVYRTTLISGIDADSTSKEPPPFPADRLKLTVRPNPATRHVVVDAPTLGTLSLYDARGFIVREQKIESPKRSIELDLTGLGAGVYFVRLMGETGMFTTPVVIYAD